MEIVTATANLRHVSEMDVVNAMTWRQIVHVGQTHLRDRMLVLDAVSEALSNIKVDDKEGGSKKAGASSSKVKRKGLPSWFTPRTGKYQVVDLDGPLHEIKSAIMHDPNAPKEG